MKRRTASALASLPLIFASACAPASGSGDEGSLPSFEDFVGGKADTGYIGSRAAELEAVFSGRVRVAVPDKTQAELEQIATTLRQDPGNWELRDITLQVTEQTKYARNALKAEALNLNLEGGTPAFTRIDVLEGALDLTYEVRVESLIKFKDLEARMLTPQDLVGRVVEPRVPLVPEGVFERAGIACATDPDSGGPASADDVKADNFFYYFDPAREGCPLTDDDLVTVRYAIESSLDAPVVYPEYDRLVADGRVDMVAIFGQITHGELKDNDWGFIAFRSMTRQFESQGFRKVRTFDGNAGHRLEKRFTSGLVVGIDMYTPVGFADDVPREQSNERFRDAMRNNEIVYYNGHAFYGSLTVLDDRAAYPEDTYQIIFMDACWSYAYYTKQIFRNRATEADPDGYALVDVVNNTEPGITGSETTAARLYDNVFKGAAAVHSEQSAEIYSWNNIIKYMNEHAEERARFRTQYPNPEIYGVSGARDNVFGRSGGGGGEEPTGGRTRYESTGAVEIPDADDAGATSVITVPETATAELGAVRVDVQIEHTYIGDLTVTLEHDGTRVVLHEGSGGAIENLTVQKELEDFRGGRGAGEWKLHVVDGAARDVGRVVRWSVEM